MSRLFTPTIVPHRDAGRTSGAGAPALRPIPWRPSMNQRCSPLIANRFAPARLLAFGLLAALAVPGCGHEEKSHYTSVAKPPTVQVIHPDVRKIVRVVGQPSFVESYEHTSIYPKLIGYIEKWNVDIGDRVKKGETLATLFVPELVEDFGTKKATVKLDEQKVELARKVVEVADADLKAAKARLDEAKAILAKYQSEVDRWATEVKRLDHEVKRGVVDPQILLESTNQWKSTTAARDAAKATIAKADAEVLSRDAGLAKAKVDVAVAQADLSVAVSEAKRIEAWVGYITLPAPFDGVVVERAANTGDFVMPASGDPSAMPRTPHLSPGGNAAPIYVVDRLDVVRIFVDIPERDANYVQIGSKASVLVQAFRDEPIPATVTRTSWALNAKSRTLRAEIDLPNPRSQLLPGMYAYAKVIIERPDVRALPVSAISYVGEKSYCWTYKDRHAARNEVQTGVTDGEWIEVTNLQRAEPSNAEHSWAPVDGSENVILGDVSVLADGAPVEVAPAAAEAKVANGAPAPGAKTAEPRSGVVARSP
ncbi:MAG: efflux RND transporter periplasmic adaptor subunit [Isosphaeraceae bacterium]|nr:efflux RND transporter periplasmic adaptor subunit [Isosphaeraceae bacterium]